MNMKQRANRIDDQIDKLFNLESGDDPNQNVVRVGNFALNRYGVDMNRTAQISLGVTMDGTVLIDSESVAYLEYCEKQLGIGENK